MINLFRHISYRHVMDKYRRKYWIVVTITVIGIVIAKNVLKASTKTSSSVIEEIFKKHALKTYFLCFTCLYSYRQRLMSIPLFCCNCCFCHKIVRNCSCCNLCLTTIRLSLNWKPLCEADPVSIAIYATSAYFTCQ